MFCKQCGQKFDEGTVQCPVCGTPTGNARTASAEMSENEQVRPVPPPPVTINDGMAPAVIATICCCPPLGIAAVIFAARVSIYAESGMIEEAKHSAKMAKILAWIGILIGLLWGFIQSLPYYLGKSTQFHEFIRQLLHS